MQSVGWVRADSEVERSSHCGRNCVGAGAGGGTSCEVRLGGTKAVL